MLLERWKKSKKFRIVAYSFLFFFLFVLHYLQLELGSGMTVGVLLKRNFLYFLENIGMIAPLYIFNILLFRRVYLGTLISGIFLCIWSLINHYVVLFSNNYLTVLLIKNVTTAMDVIGGYRISLDGTVLFILLTELLSIGICYFFKKSLPHKLSKRKWGSLLCIFLIFIGSMIGFRKWNEKEDFIGLDAKHKVMKTGYLVYFIDGTVESFSNVQTSFKYDAKTMNRVFKKYQNRGVKSDLTEYPDIVLILNESLYDVDYYTSTKSDVDYLSNWRNMENAIRGYVTVPRIGTGTNATEYELLTSNSMYMFPDSVPFVDLDLKDANSIVNYLQSLGYQTWAMHERSQVNYNRGNAFAQLGFDEVKFSISFLHFTSYGNRASTDAANYQDLFGWYEIASDGPRFMYLLTYQNHGGYEQNDAALDTVHVNRSFGKYTSSMEEYLTSIRMSDEAIQDLISYFDKVDRPVVVCMLGDHSPEFVQHLESDQGLSAEEKEIRLRSTPFFIWTNQAYGTLKTTVDVHLSTVDIIPYLFNIIGLPLSPYYQSVLNLSSQVPIRLSTGFYVDKKGKEGIYLTDDTYQEILDDYYYMEYNNLDVGDRYQVLFEAPR